MRHRKQGKEFSRMRGERRQFEREVRGERIRDKIAASKRKGMWMGGLVPLGYDVHERRLAINQSEAETVRRIIGFGVAPADLDGPIVCH
jgi:DNA invertase Pin-like site-specific DNA recombinase